MANIRGSARNAFLSARHALAQFLDPRLSPTGCSPSIDDQGSSRGHASFAEHNEMSSLLAVYQPASFRFQLPQGARPHVSPCDAVSGT